MEYADVAINRTGGFLIGMIVARLLSPHDFGVYAVALVVHASIINVSELGASTALVCDDDGEVGRTAPTVTTIALLSSVSLGVDDGGIGVATRTAPRVASRDKDDPGHGSDAPACWPVRGAGHVAAAQFSDGQDVRWPIPLTLASAVAVIFFALAAGGHWLSHGHSS